MHICILHFNKKQHKNRIQQKSYRTRMIVFVRKTKDSYFLYASWIILASLASSYLGLRQLQYLSPILIAIWGSKKLLKKLWSEIYQNTKKKLIQTKIRLVIILKISKQKPGNFLEINILKAVNWLKTIVFHVSKA